MVCDSVLKFSCAPNNGSNNKHSDKDAEEVAGVGKGLDATLALPQKNMRPRSGAWFLGDAFIGQSDPPRFLFRF